MACGCVSGFFLVCPPPPPTPPYSRGVLLLEMEARCFDFASFLSPTHLAHLQKGHQHASPPPPPPACLKFNKTPHPHVFLFR